MRHTNMVCVRYVIVNTLRPGDKSDDDDDDNNNNNNNNNNDIVCLENEKNCVMCYFSYTVAMYDNFFMPKYIITDVKLLLQR